MKALGILFIVLMLAGLFGGCVDSEYERAGKEFNSWVNTNPSKWTDTQKDYFNNFMDWADKN